MDLGEDHLPLLPAELSLTPPSMSPEDFKEKFPELACSVTLNMGQNVVCHVAQEKVFVSCTTKFHMPGLLSSTPKVAFLYAGGNWISESNKAGWRSAFHRR